MKLIQLGGHPPQLNRLPYNISYQASYQAVYGGG